MQRHLLQDVPSPECALAKCANWTPVQPLNRGSSPVLPTLHCRSGWDQARIITQTLCLGPQNSFKIAARCYSDRWCYVRLTWEGGNPFCPNILNLSGDPVPRLRIRIHLIRIQHFRLNSYPYPIRILGFDDENGKKFTAEKKIYFFGIKNYNLPIPRPP